MAGLTLIEIMIVIALLGVLGTVIAVNLTDALDDNSADAAKLQMSKSGLVSRCVPSKQGQVPWHLGWSGRCEEVLRRKQGPEPCGVMSTNTSLPGRTSMLATSW